MKRTKVRITRTEAIKDCEDLVAQYKRQIKSLDSGNRIPSNPDTARRRWSLAIEEHLRNIANLKQYPKNHVFTC